jgi:hypothetical protein
MSNTIPYIDPARVSVQYIGLCNSARDEASLPHQVDA